MSTIITNRLFRISIALTGAVGLFGATNVFAEAGDTIGNTATIGYSVGGNPQTSIQSSPTGNSTGAGEATEFVEDRLINFSVAQQDGISILVTPSATLRVQTYLVTNDGNDTQDFIFSALNNGNGTNDPHGGVVDNFDVVSPQVFVETANAGFDFADDTAIFADQIAPTGTVTVYIVSTIPDGTVVSSGDLAVMTLVAQVADGSAASADDAVAANAGVAIMNDDNGQLGVAGTYNNGATTTVVPAASDIPDDAATVQDVFNEPAGTSDSAGNVGVVKIGQTSDNSSYTVQTATLTVTKTALTHFDPVNANSNPKAIPDATVRYTITIENAAGGADAVLTDVSDVLAMLMDDQFGDADAVNTPLSLANNVRITDGANSVIFCQADNGDANSDGCTWNGAVGDTLTVDLSAVVGITDQLLAGQTLTVEFDVIVP